MSKQNACQNAKVLDMMAYSGLGDARFMEAQVLLIPIFMVELIPTETKKMRNNRNSSKKTNPVNL